MRRSQSRLAGEKTIVHFPKLALISCASGRFVRLEGLFVNRLEREIAKHVSHFSSLDVVMFELRVRFFDVPRAKAAFVIGKLDQRDRRIWFAFGRSVGQ